MRPQSRGLSPATAVHSARADHARTESYPESRSQSSPCVGPASGDTTYFPEPWASWPAWTAKTRYYLGGAARKGGAS